MKKIYKSAFVIMIFAIVFRVLLGFGFGLETTLQLVESLNMPFLCKLLPDSIPFQGGNFQGGCIQSIAIQKKDYTICSALNGGPVGTCYAQVAIASKNISPCNIFATWAEKNTQQLAGSLNAPQAEGVIESLISSCYQTYLRAVNNPADCDLITLNDQKNLCKVSLNNSIDSETDTIDEEKICDEIQTPSTQNNCWFSLALEKKDGLFCTKMHSLDSRSQINRLTIRVPQDCFERIARDTQNSTVCLLSEEIPVRDHCFMVMAHELSDHSLCSSIVDKGTKKACESYR